MSLLLVILKRILEVLMRVGAVERHLDRIEETLSQLSQAVQDANAKLDQILDLLLIGGADHFVFTVQVEGQEPITGATNVTFTDNQRAQLTIQPLDKKGKPASLDGVPVWASSDETVVTVELGVLNPDGTITPDATGLQAVAEAVVPGSARISVTGDADLGPGTAPITGVLDVSVTPGQATVINITAGAPVDAP